MHNLLNKVPHVMCIIFLPPVLFSDRKRNRIKSLDEYYHIRAKITCNSISQDIIGQSQPRNPSVQKQQAPLSQRMLLLLLVFLLVMTWIYLVSVVTNVEVFSLPLHALESSFAALPFGSIISHVIHLPFTLLGAIHEAITSRPNNYSLAKSNMKRAAFVSRMDNPDMNKALNELAVRRANYHMAVRQKMSSSVARNTRQSSKLDIFDSAAEGLFHLASLLDDGLNPKLNIAGPYDNEDANMSDQGNVDTEEADDDNRSEQINAELRAVESKLIPLQEYSTSVSFVPKLDDFLYLVGAGVRKKSIIKVYAVAMYSSPSVLDVASTASLARTARTFDSLTPTTSFLLEMVYSVGAEKIAGAIAESVKPRYDGQPSDIEALESLIVEGVNKIGGQAVKGTKFRFDCSQEGVSVTVDELEQGRASFEGLGSAFVDVFIDVNAVSPTLVDSCVETWSKPEAIARSSKLLKLTNALQSTLGSSEELQSESEEDNEEAAILQKAIEGHMKPIKEYATSVIFAPTLDELFLVGAGVRKKSIISVYAVAMYSSTSVVEVLSQLQQGKGQRKVASSALRTAARTFDSYTPITSFVLEMVYSAGAEKIAGAIAESVKPRYDGLLSDIGSLEFLIIQGVNSKGGQASKGTVFRFDCSETGVKVSVDGNVQGIASFEGLGSAFVDVFMDDNAVSPTLIDSCIDTWTAVALG